MTEIIVMPVVTTQGNMAMINEGKQMRETLDSLLSDGYKVTHLASSEFNGALHNTYVLEKNFE